MDRFTMELKAWLDTPEKERDLAEGALLVLRANRNKIMYANFMRRLKESREAIEYNVKKWYDFRLQQKTHAEVEQMAAEVRQMSLLRQITENSEERTVKSESEGVKSESEDTHQTGKRADHDELPLEVQALYVENLDIMRRMREVHLRLRTLTEQMKDGEMCPDSDRYPFLKELIGLDKQYHANWKKYDEYKVEELKG